MVAIWVHSGEPLNNFLQFSPISLMTVSHSAGISVRPGGRPQPEGCSGTKHHVSEPNSSAPFLATHSAAYGYFL